MTYILGLNAYHGDAAACLLGEDGLIAAAEEERFRRIKHWSGFPEQAIQYCLREAGITLDAVNRIAINRDPKAALWRKVLHTAKTRPSAQSLLAQIKRRRSWSNIEQGFDKISPGLATSGRIHHVEHHVAHIASAFLTAPFEEALAISIDGLGDFASACWALCKGDTIRPLGRIYFPHSLGVFYEAMTQYLGFPNYGDEYKVMGLAPYGEPRFVAAMRQILNGKGDGTYRLEPRLFLHEQGRVTYTWNNCAPEVSRLFSPAVEDLLGPARQPGTAIEQRHKDIARSAQEIYEERVFALINSLQRRYSSERLVLAGGCAMNSVANGKVHLKTGFKQIWVPPAAGDAGGAIGSALIASQAAGGPKRLVMNHAYLGPHFSDAEIAGVLQNASDNLKGIGCDVRTVADDQALVLMTARAISAGKVVGWFQGRMEWGPRALGNRSILGDPRRADMKDILNAKIKRRESFRPFAPSILREAVFEWFEDDMDVPFMTSVLRIRDSKRSVIPAVTHVDGTGRLHTVSAEANPLYYGLIAAFRELTGVPLVLNTSFNESEPVVCRPEEALDCFLRTGMDLLVMGRHVLSRTAAQAEVTSAT